MIRNNNLKHLTLLTGAALAMGVTASSAIAADSNPFGMTELSQGFNVAANTESKCGAAKCGANKKASTESASKEKTAEGKCGEGKAKAAEGKCGGSKEKAAEGKCGGNK
jgi:uncharacterized low-complexity protein